MKMSRLKFSGILIIITIFCLFIFARSQINSQKFVKEEKKALVYLYISDHGNYEWTFLTTGLWPGDGMAAYWGPWPQEYNDIPMIYFGRFYISNSTDYHYWGDTFYAWEEECTIKPMLSLQELSYLDSISQKDILTGWSYGISNDPDSCISDGLTIGCTWRSLQWNTENWDEFIPAIWTLFNYGNKLVENFYITLEMDWDIPDADYENNAVKYYPEVRGSRVFNLNTDLSGGIIFLGDDPKNMMATSWDDAIWLTGDTQEYAWFWTNIVNSDELSTRTQPDDYRVFYTFGPISLNPGEKYDFVWAFVFGEDEADWLKNAETLQAFGPGPYPLIPPAPPDIELSSQNNQVKIRWSRNRIEVTEGKFNYSSESSIDPIRQKPDWDGYRIYRNMTGTGTIEDGDWHFVTELNSTYVYETWGTIPSDELKPEYWKRTYWAEFTDKGPGLYTGFKYFYSVVAYDISNSKSEPEDNAKSIVVSGNNRIPSSSVVVIPNPYKVFNHPSFGESVIFTNLPPICTIKIYTLGGELVKKIKHENQSGDERWNLNNDNGKKIASGIYLYTIESSQGIQKGKIAIIK